ncbi:MAG TPA: electron transfer flavoprotein subunit beta/FixA family protein [Dehalococcoidia bacterium]|nr:electron transfer flavoprotein subunit beta/FixA family protein [Dehalococcoidia bacterium]
MDMIVCVKQILDPETPPSAFKVDEAAKKVIPAQGMSPVINPFDSQAVEAALRIRDATGSGKITVLSMGPASARDAVKHGLAMGADEGILIDDPALADADSFVSARVLAAAIKKIGAFDVVFCGRQAADWDMGIVGPGLGELLGVPAVTITKSAQATDGHLRVERVLMDGFETVDVPVPCVVTISNELGDPRYPQLRQIMVAARKQVVVWTAADLGLTEDDLRSPLKLERLYVPVKESHVEIIEGDTVEEQAKNLARRLREVKLI